MITEYTTRDGHVLELGRLPRQAIDTFASENKPPTPPMKDAETWAGVEQIEDHDAPEYKAAISKYYIDTNLAQLELICDAVQVVLYANNADVELQALRIAHSKASMLAILIQDPSDLQILAEMVIYNSTVTPRGITEAARQFGVTWFADPVNPFSVIPGHASALGLYNDQMAARWGGYLWEDFCQLTGPRQSEVVALYRLDSLLRIASMQKPEG